jgi:hypothetical protein
VTCQKIIVFESLHLWSCGLTPAHVTHFVAVLKTLLHNGFYLGIQCLSWDLRTWSYMSGNYAIVEVSNSFLHAHGELTLTLVPLGDG